MAWQTQSHQGCERLKFKKRDCFQWGDAEGINKQ